MKLGTRHALALCGPFLFAASCRSPAASEKPGSSGAAEEAAKDEEVSSEKIHIAEMELALARLEGEQEIAAAELAVKKARQGQEQVRTKKAGFESGGRALKLDEARLALDRARGRASDAEAELAELEAMYKEEEFAEKTKELVLARGRRELEHARRDLGLSERRLKQLEEFELTGEANEVEKDATEAQKDLLEAEQALAKLRLEKEIAIEGRAGTRPAQEEGREEGREGDGREGEEGREGAVRPAVPSILAPLLLAATSAAQDPEIPERLGPAEAGAAVDRALAWLVRTQRPDGSWAAGVLDSLAELGYSVESYYSWKVAADALACLALLHAPETPERRAALERGVGWLCSTRAPKRGSDWDIDYVWGGLYGFVACTEIAADRRFANEDWQGLIAPAGRRYLAILEKNQVPTGGWGYYDDPIYSRPPKWATSFSTAVVLPALQAGEKLGWVTDPRIRERATRYVERCALPNGAFAYDLRPVHYWRRFDDIDQVKGSLCRIQVCHWALAALGEKKITPERIREGLENLLRHHRFLDEAFMRPIPHEAYYYNSGYFYLFGHYYAAQVIELLPEAERETWHARLRPHLVKVQRADGSTSDFLTSDYMLVAGTAYLALALELGLPPGAAARDG